MRALSNIDSTAYGYALGGLSNAYDRRRNRSASLVRHACRKLTEHLLDQIRQRPLQTWSIQELLRAQDTLQLSTNLIFLQGHQTIISCGS